MTESLSSRKRLRGKTMGRVSKLVFQKKRQSAKRQKREHKINGMALRDRDKINGRALRDRKGNIK